ncbi:ankyrin repeat domain-containing protein 33B-like [Tachypleus tridentatus]|uniref:ankyrin repeat domain-containing protein 33B-like n=1 Tax=Tachypleus tridentatus TaxID=6853 RepID=UPI003FD0350D
MTQRGTFSSEPVVGRHVVAQTTYPRTMAMDENQHFGASINEPSVIDYHTYLVKSGYNIEPLLFSNYHRRAFSMYNTDRQPTVDVTFLLACRDGSLFQLKTVIQRGPSPATVNQQDHCGRTGLNHVCANGQLAMLQLLADLPDLDPNLPDNEGCTPLMMASQAGHVEIVTFLLRVFRETIVVDQRNVFGVTALMKASLQGRGRCVKVLLASGANSLLRDPSRKFCSLDWARFCGRQSCVEILEKFMKTTVGKACLANQQKIGGSKDKWSSDPDLQSPLHSNASLPDIHTGKTTSKHVGGENGWFKQKTS